MAAPFVSLTLLVATAASGYELSSRRRHFGSLQGRRLSGATRRPQLAHPRLPAASPGEGQGEGEGSGYTLKLDWLLADAVPAFTVGEDRPATFWVQLAAATPELSGFGPEQLEARYAELVADASAQSSNRGPAARAGPQPLLLDRWSWADVGRVTGTLESGSAVWVTVAARGFLANDPAASEERDPAPSLFGVSLPAPAPKALEERPGGWVMATGGTVYELGQQAVEGAAVTGSGPLAQLSQLSLVSNLASLVIVIAGTVGFVAGTSFEESQRSTLRQPSPGFVMTTQNRVSPRGSSSVVVLDNTPKAELTLQEQRMRQERRVESQELRISREADAIIRIEEKLANDKVRLQSDKGRLEELRRVEAERGGDAVVKLP